jgi:Fe2+ transport system protein B
MSIPYESPDPSLVASIRHEAEKLGYLVARVEEMFRSRVTYERRQALIAHSLESMAIERKWLDGELSDEQASELQATLAEATASFTDSIKMAFDKNISRLNQIVLDGVTSGKSQQNELNDALDQILSQE